MYLMPNHKKQEKKWRNNIDGEKEEETRTRTSTDGRRRNKDL